MRRSWKLAVIAVAFIGLLVVVGLLAGLAAQPKVARPSIAVLGVATNYLKFDKDRSWIAFSVSNAMTRTITYVATAVDFQTEQGWTSNGWQAASLMTRRETPGLITSGGSDVFYASIPKGRTPWRLHISCSVTNRHSRWENGTYELISAEITP